MAFGHFYDYLWLSTLGQFHLFLHFRLCLHFLIPFDPTVTKPINIPIVRTNFRPILVLILQNPHELLGLVPEFQAFLIIIVDILHPDLFGSHEGSKVERDHSWDCGWGYRG